MNPTNYAFPSDIPLRKAPDGSILERQHGATLWDYYAAHALAGLCANDGIEFYEEVESLHSVYAKHAAKMADAMMAERELRGIK